MQHIQLEAADLERLVKSSGEGDAEAFGMLYDVLYDKLYSYAFKRTFSQTDAEDITANAFYNIMTHLNLFKWQDSARFYAWVFRIMMHEIATYYRKGSKYTLVEEWLDIADNVRHDQQSQLDALVVSERDRQLHEAVNSLPEKNRLVVELYYFAHLSHAEIAKTLGIREGAARVRLHRALETLQIKMQGEEYAYRG